MLTDNKNLVSQNVKYSNKNPITNLAAQIFGNLIAKTTIDGSVLSAGLPATLSNFLLVNAMKNIKQNAITEALKIPFIGQTISDFIATKINVMSLSIINPNQVLKTGQNSIPIILNFGGQDEQFTMILNNVQQTSNVNHLAGQILASLIANHQIDGSALNAGLPASLGLGLVWSAITAVKAQAVSIASKLPFAGQQISDLIDRATIDHLTLVNPEQVLTVGDNSILANLKFGDEVVPFNVILSGVK